MMDHETIQDLLSSYLDGDLSPDERQQVDAHLAECEACREELALLELTLAALHDLPELEAPAGFADAVMDRVEAESGAEVVPITRARRKVPVWAPVALAAAACLMVGLVWVASPWTLATRDRAAEPGAPVSLAEAAQEETLDGLAWEEEERSAEKSRFAQPSLIAEAEPAADMPSEPTLDDALADLEAGAEGDGRFADASPAPPGVVTLPADEAASAAGGAVATGSTAATTRDGAYYTRWEQDGDALASGEGESAGESRKAAAEYRATDHAQRQEPARGVEERERLDREEEAFRRIYGEDSEDDESSGDAVADMGVLEDYLDDADLGDAGEYDGLLASDRRSVAANDLDRVEAKSRTEADFSDEEVADEVSVGRVARQRETRRDSSRGDRGGWARKKAEQAPVEAPAAAAREQAFAPSTESQGAAEPEATEAAPAARAEWTLQTTDPTVLYGLAQLCASIGGLDCRFVSPYTGPVSLNAQQNYQVLEATVVGSNYGDLQARLQSIGSLLVRTEDLATADQGDLVVVKIVVEYLP